MANVSDDPQLARLMAELSWLHRLARALLRDEADADDLVQDTWLVASQRAPADTGSLRPWLGRVALNLVRMRSRGDKRRAAREAAAEVQVDGPATPDEAIIRVEAQRAVVDEVLRLAEPYRSTLVLHFFEDLPCAEIARRHGIPDGTVRRRLKVALDELRARLRADEMKTGRSVLAALAPMASMPAAPATSTWVGVGVIAMKKIVVAAVLMLVAALIALSVRGNAQEQAAKNEQVVLVGQVRPPTEPGGVTHAWFVARNAPTRKLAGRVIYRGVPIKDVVVSLHSALSLAGRIAPVEVRTDESGRFDFGILPPTQYFVTASSPGTNAAIVQLDLADPTLRPASDQLELLLSDCTATVEGTVYDAVGNSLPDVHVRRAGLVGVDSNERGQYKLCVPFGDVEIKYGRDGFGSVLLTIDARGEMHRDVVLVPEATLSVRVVRADDGQAVADAHVFVAPVDWGPDRAATSGGVADNDGRVRIDGLVPGRYRIFGRANDGMQVREQIEAVAQVGIATEAVLKLELTARISGTVVHGNKPVAGANVVAIRKMAMGAQGSQVGVSQADGSFVVDYVPPGDVVFEASPFAVDSPASLKIEAGKTYDGVVLDVYALATIRGRVTRLGKPVAGADVCCVPSVFPPHIPTDGNGRYEFRGVAPNTYNIQAASEGIGAFTLDKSITVGAGQERVLDFELDLAATIAGVVVDRDGKPVQGVFVRWLHEKTGDVGRCITDALGRYRCGAMTGGGNYRAGVYASLDAQDSYPTADGGPYPVLNVKDRTTAIGDIRLVIDRPRVAISGRVLDERGDPVADALVKALAIPEGRSAEFKSWQRFPWTSTDGDGGFTIPNLAAGRYALQARAADGSEGVASTVVAGTDGVTIQIERAGSIEGKLVGFKQPPTVLARPMNDSKQVSGTVDGATFRIAGLRPGRYLVNAQTPNEGDIRMIDVRSGQITKMNMTSHGQAVIEGTVIDFRSRAPIANASCHAVMSIDGEPVLANWDLGTGTKSDANGRIRLDPAPAGNVTITCRIAGGRWSPPSADARVAAGGRAVVQLMSTELATENASTIGIEFNWNSTPPRISAVLPNSPAGKAGISAGDLVTEVNATSVEGLNGPGVDRLIASVPANDEVRITVLRGAETKMFSVRALSGF